MSYQSLKCCNCSDGVKLQLDLINHLLSHMTLAIKIDFEEDDLLSEQQIVKDNIDHLHQSPQKIKSKPSYHKQYNRRDRSPNTFLIQQEFTQDPDSKMFFCNFCRNSYKHKQTVERHLSKEHYQSSAGGPKRTSSDTFIPSQSTESEEIGFTMDPETRQFYCSFCRNVYKHKQTIERHLVKEHNYTVSKVRLSHHQHAPSFNVVEVKSETRKKDKKLTCDQCGQHFLFRESLRKHLLRHVEPSTRLTKRGKTIREKIVCDQCTKLVHPSLMKRHFQVHHSDYRPFRCEEPGCKTTFFDITKFKDHQNIHLNVKPYICEFCSESFHYASNYRQHKLRHTHPDRFKCETCASCFVSSKSLRMHMRLHTDDPDAPKPYACEHEGCDKTFRYLDRLKLHFSNVHRQEMEHKCNSCQFVTHRRKYIKRHMMKVHNVREGNPRARVFPAAGPDF